VSGGEDPNLPVKSENSVDYFLCISEPF